MGTSKGYIAPSTPNWASAKRGVSDFISHPTESNKQSAAAKYARAVNVDESMLGKVASAFSDFIGFVSSSNHNGVSQALIDYKKENLKDLSPEEDFSELINSFTEGNTIDDIIANNCISDALLILGIESVDDFSKIEYNELIKELVCQFAMQKFAQLFDKHIMNKCDSVVVARTREKDIKEYIYYTVKFKLTDDEITEINPRDIANEHIIKDIIKKAFDILEHYYD